MPKGRLQLVNVYRQYLGRGLAYDHETKPCKEEYTPIDVSDGVEKWYRLGLFVDRVDVWRRP